MDARERLRRYLEQRREMGEHELVLDGLSVEEVMRLLGAARLRGTAPVERERVPRRVVDESGSATKSPAPPANFGGDWREALRSAGAADTAAGEEKMKPRSEPKITREPAPESKIAREPAPEPASTTEPTPQPKTEAEPATPLSPGIIVGSSDRELFTGPFSQLDSIGKIARTVAGCTRCPLYETAKNAVPGEGNPNAELVCVGEAPGATEDETGRPFVGQAGQLLTKILGAINLAREDVFICNVLKHRPPGNRNPFPKEVEACSPYLVRQLELIRPKAILALGTFAAQTLLNTKLSIGKLRGAVHKYHGIPLIVTYHPAALLRNPAWKRPTWEDVQHVRRILDSAPPGGAP